MWDIFSKIKRDCNNSSDKRKRTDEIECFFNACPSLKATYRDLQGGWLRKYQMLEVTPSPPGLGPH